MNLASSKQNTTKGSGSSQPLLPAALTAEAPPLTLCSRPADMFGARWTEFAPKRPEPRSAATMPLRDS
jgi:hypothetical protein